MSARFRIGQGEVVVVATVQGLVAERDRVLALLEAERPDVVALGLSAEAVSTLLRYEPQPDVDLFEDLPDHDYVYSIKLREHGDVELPPPDQLAAARWAQERGVTLYGVDLAEEAYETLFTKSVSTFGFLRYGRIQRRLARKPPHAPDARAFALAWDKKIRKVKGIRIVEAARERHMAEQAARLARDTPGKVVLVLDVAREAGVLQALASAGSPTGS